MPCSDLGGGFELKVPVALGNKFALTRYKQLLQVVVWLTLKEVSEDEFEKNTSKKQFLSKLEDC